MIRLDRRDRRALVFGLAVIVPVLFAKTVALPYLRALRSANQHLGVERGLLARERGLLAETRNRPDRGHGVAVLVEAERRRLLEGSDQLAASAVLVSYVGDVAAQSRVLIQQSEGRAGEPVVGKLSAIQVSFRAESDFEGAMRFALALERGPTLLRLEQLTVETGTSRYWVRDQQGETLSLMGVVTGYVMPSAPAAWDQ